MKKLFKFCLVSLLLTGITHADELGFEFDFLPQEPGSLYTYNVYKNEAVWPDGFGLVEGNFGPDGIPNTSDDVKTFLQTNNHAGNCEESPYFLTRTGIEGESEPSVTVTSMPRPEIVSIKLNAATNAYRIEGDNFPTDVQVKADGVLIEDGVNRISCQLIEFPNPGDPPETVTVINPQPEGTLTVLGSITVSLTPTGAVVF